MYTRKPVDYTEMYSVLDRAANSSLTQTEMYLVIGQAVCSREEKGAAVAAATYLQTNYPDMRGFSPRNLRRMREFYRTYAQHKELFPLTMQISWTQNVTILEANLTTQERAWYLQQTAIHNWSKRTLIQNIKEELHKNETLNTTENRCDAIKTDAIPETRNDSTSAVQIQSIDEAVVVHLKNFDTETTSLLCLNRSSYFP